MRKSQDSGHVLSQVEGCHRLWADKVEGSLLPSSTDLPDRPERVIDKGWSDDLIGESRDALPPRKCGCEATHDFGLPKRLCQVGKGDPGDRAAGTSVQHFRFRESFGRSVPIAPSIRRAVLCIGRVTIAFEDVVRGNLDQEFAGLGARSSELARTVDIGPETSTLAVTAFRLGLSHIGERGEVHHDVGRTGRYRRAEGFHIGEVRLQGGIGRQAPHLTCPLTDHPREAGGDDLDTGLRRRTWPLSVVGLLHEARARPGRRDDARAMRVGASVDGIRKTATSAATLEPRKAQP